MQNRFYNDKPAASVTDWPPPPRWNYRRRYNKGHYGEHAAAVAEVDYEDYDEGGKLNRLEEGAHIDRICFVLFLFLSTTTLVLNSAVHRRKLINPGFVSAAFIQSQLWPHPIYWHPIYPFVPLLYS